MSDKLLCYAGAVGALALFWLAYYIKYKYVDPLKLREFEDSIRKRETNREYTAGLIRRILKDATPAVRDRYIDELVRSLIR